jgi:hypothetical protein
MTQSTRLCHSFYTQSYFEREFTLQPSFHPHFSKNFKTKSWQCYCGWVSLSTIGWWSPCSYQSEKIMLIHVVERMRLQLGAFSIEWPDQNFSGEDMAQVSGMSGKNGSLSLNWSSQIAQKPGIFCVLFKYFTVLICLAVLMKSALGLVAKVKGSTTIYRTLMLTASLQLRVFQTHRKVKLCLNFIFIQITSANTH